MGIAPAGHQDCQTRDQGHGSGARRKKIKQNSRRRDLPAFRRRLSISGKRPGTHVERSEDCPFLASPYLMGALCTGGGKGSA